MNDDSPRDGSEPEIAKCKLQEVKREIPSWMSHRNRLLEGKTTAPTRKPTKKKKSRMQELDESDADAYAAFANAGRKSQADSDADAYAAYGQKNSDADAYAAYGKNSDADAYAAYGQNSDANAYLAYVNTGRKIPIHSDEDDSDEDDVEDSDFDAQAAYRNAGKNNNSYNEYTMEIPTVNSSDESMPPSASSAENTPNAEKRNSVQFDLNVFHTAKERANAINEQDNSRRLDSTNGDSGWSTPSETDITTSSNESAQNSPTHDYFQEILGEPDNRNRTGSEELSLEMISESNRGDGQFLDETYESTLDQTGGISDDGTDSDIEEEIEEESVEYIVDDEMENTGHAGREDQLANTLESSRDEGPLTRRTKSQDSESTIPPESVQRPQPELPSKSIKHPEAEDTEDDASMNSTTKLPEETESEDDSSMNSEKSFWGNLLRFADPNEDGSGPANVNGDLIQSILKTDNDNGSPDPPGTNDGNVHKNVAYKQKRKVKLNDESNSLTPRKLSDWMPPKPGSLDENASVDDDINSADPASRHAARVVKDVMRQIDNASETDANGEPRHQGTSKRIDFTGQTTSYNQKSKRKLKKNAQEAEIDRSDRSFGEIRKYYDNEGKADEKVRSLYMPTMVPSISDYTSEDEVFDWVPIQARDRISERYKRSTEDDEDDIEMVGTDVHVRGGEIEPSGRGDIEANHSTSRQTKSKSSSYFEVVDSQSESDTVDNTVEFTAENQDYEQAIVRDVLPTTFESNENLKSCWLHRLHRKSPCICYIVTFLMIILIPGIAVGIVFLIKYFAGKY